MMKVIILSTSLLVLTKMIVRAYEIRSMPLFDYGRMSLTHVLPVKNLPILLHPSELRKQCFVNGILTECPVHTVNYSSNIITNIGRNVQEDALQDGSNSGIERTSQANRNSNEPFRRLIDLNPANNLKMLSSLGKSAGSSLTPSTGLPISINTPSTSSKLNVKLNSSSTKPKSVVTNESLTETMDKLSSRQISAQERSQELELTPPSTKLFSSAAETTLEDIPILEQFTQSLDNFERKFYAITFSKLSSLAPPPRRENGMSYVQSGLFLQLALMALSTEVGPEARQEIEESLGLHASEKETVELINATVSSLPASSEDLKFRWSSRLVLQSVTISEKFRTNAAQALRLQIDRFNGTETSKEMAETLNHMVEVDSGGAIHDTFEEDDLSDGVRAVLITTLYLRARWRSAPTLLNSTRPFYDSESAPNRSVRMIRVNDNMRYADLTEWDAEALEIFYSTPGLSLLMLVPRGNSVRRLADEMLSTNLRVITEKMQALRIAATLPLYTLRMTLLLPNKLEAMNISHLVNTTNGSQSDSLRLSHAVQRIMFWAEAGRNAFKDDGLEWDEAPQRELVIDRPYIFYVRWQNKTLMNGNFVL